MVTRMIVRLKPDLMVVTAESSDERESLIEWAGQFDGNAFVLMLQDSQTVRFISKGPEAEACREPINVTSRSLDPDIKLISNFAHTPFELDGVLYGSVEAFWQSLKFAEDDRRAEIAPLFGKDALQAGKGAIASTTLVYNGKMMQVGTFEHWQLMKMACQAKFNQHEPAKAALLGTGERPLTHITRNDSRTIPGIMADIWMRIRHGLRNPMNRIV